MKGAITLSKPFDRLLLEEMVKEDEDDLMFSDDDDMLDGLLETTSFKEELSEIFPPEEKFEEVS